MQRYEKYLYAFTVLLAASIVLFVPCYLTGDGPSHTYNARILLDILTNTKHREYYTTFYQVQRSLDPNWTGHLVLGVLLPFLSPIWADKMLQLLYILLFCTGIRYLIRSINPENTFLSFLFYPFLFTLPFQQGFYNYSLALALALFTIGYTLRHRQQWHDPVKTLCLSLLMLCTVFSHGMAWVYVLAFWVILTLLDQQNLFSPLQFRRLVSEWSRYLLILLPSAIILLLFLMKRGVSTEAHPLSLLQKAGKAFMMYASQSTRLAEQWPAMACSLLLTGFWIYSLWHRNKSTVLVQQKVGYAFMAFALLLSLVYLICPHSVGGAGSLDIRLAFLPPLFLLCWLATRIWSHPLKVIFISCSILISLGFTLIRFPYVYKASLSVQEIMEASPHLPAQGVVLNLHFDYWQQHAKGPLFEQDGSFLHASDFLGAQSSHQFILLNNYEAEINYFPINWQPRMNIRETSPGFIQGDLPPCGKLSAWEKQSGHPIEMVWIQHWQPKYAQYPCVQDLWQQLRKDYQLRYRSRNGRLLVYEKRKVLSPS